MGVRKLSTASIKTNNKSTKFADGATGTFELIQRITVTSPTPIVEWDNIPSVYNDLQLRIMAQGNYTSETTSYLTMRFNGVSSANYTRHDLGGFYGTSTAQAYAFTGYTGMALQRLYFNTTSSNTFSPIITDIFDYKNTNKNKAFKGIGGFRTDTNGQIVFHTGVLTANTNAITKITLDNGAYNFNPNSTFALYGIRSA